MSTRYPGDTQDALFMEDGSPWWESPDIGIGSLAGGVANEGTNTVHVRVHTNGEPFTPSTARTQVWVGNPSLVMTPTAGTVAVGTFTVTQAEFTAGGGTVEKTLPWLVTADPSNPSGPDQPGHRCVIARVFPFGTPVPTDFAVPTDQHEAQRNISIVAADDAGAPGGGAGGGMAGAPGGKPMGPGEDGLWEFWVDTTMPLTLKRSPVTIAAGPTQKVSDETLELIAKSLEGQPFDGLAEPTRKFMLDFDLPKERLPLDPEGCPWRPKVGEVTFDERRLQTTVPVWLEPEQIARFALKADLNDTPPGQVQVFHLEQTGDDGNPQGGLTVVFYKAR
jgi:hypothetical protein